LSKNKPFGQKSEFQSDYTQSDYTAHPARPTEPSPLFTAAMQISALQCLITCAKRASLDIKNNSAPLIPSPKNWGSKIDVRKNRDSLQRNAQSLQLSGVAANRSLEYTSLVGRGRSAAKSEID
jgi:hypothetical protein